MGRHSKATLAHVSNLGHPQKKFQAHVEDITDPQNPDFDESRPQNHPVGEDQRIQQLYFDHDHPTMPGWFKGMEIII